MRYWIDIWYVNWFWPNTDEVIVFQAWPTFTGHCPFVFHTFLWSLIKYWLQIWYLETPSFSKTVTLDTNIWYKGTKKHNLWKHSDSKNKYSETDIIKMLEFLVDNIFVAFVGKVFQQTVGIPMGTNCADIFVYSHEADFIKSLLSTGKKQLASWFNLYYRYIDDVLSINNPEFENYLG